MPAVTGGLDLEFVCRLDLAQVLALHQQNDGLTDVAGMEVGTLERARPGKRARRWCAGNEGKQVGVCVILMTISTVAYSRVI